jgi:hypothetical protein
MILVFMMLGTGMMGDGCMATDKRKSDSVLFWVPVLSLLVVGIVLYFVTPVVPGIG